MAKYVNDVSDYIATATDPARLVVTFVSRGGGDTYAVTADVDGEPPMTGQFVISPEWQLRIRRPALVKAYPAEPGQDVGAQLFNALFSGSLSRVWAQARDRARAKNGLHIVIQSSSPPLQNLPWELLSDTMLTSSEHVAIAEGWSVVRDVHDSLGPTGTGARPVQARAQVSVAVLTSPISGVEQRHDAALLTDAFGPTAVTVQHDVDARAVIQQLASGWAQVVHVVGNGVPGRLTQDLLLSSTTGNPSVARASDLRKAASATEELQLVVLAACDTDQLAAQLAEAVPAVIGIRGTISDAGCRVFLSGLYHALASGSRVTQAVAAGRAQLVSFSQSLGEEWAQPVLYLAGDGPLLTRTTPPAYPEPVDLPRTAPGDDATDDLLVEIKRANLRALRDQWGQVDSAHIPAVVADQIAVLEREVDELTGGTR